MVQPDRKSVTPCLDPFCRFFCPEMTSVACVSYLYLVIEGVISVARELESGGRTVCRASCRAWRPLSGGGGSFLYT
jgi:hypothetical protein